jgi:LmbE family N-acetylglucosaminyl deacetylase
MELKNKGAQIFVPDGKSVEDALKRTTHMGISAHQDDLEIMAYHGILECFGREDHWFTGVVATNGAGSARSGLYENFTDEDMQAIRKEEQKKAAFVGEYAAAVFLDYPSSGIKNSQDTNAKEEIKKLIELAQPEVIYTHNLADKHDTHVSVTLRTISAIRELQEDKRPKKLLGCEVWRSLDWLLDEDKVLLNVSTHENLSASLLGVFDSQISGGKRYDLATTGRRLANATYFESHGVDQASSLIFAMELTPLILDGKLDINQYVQEYIQRFAQDVSAKISRFT